MTKVKICGVKRIEDAEILDGEVDYVGLIIDPTVNSPRKVDHETARLIVKRLRKSEPVGVVVSREGIDTAYKLGIKIVQYHSDREPIREILNICEKYGIDLAPVVIYRGDERTCLLKLEEIIRTVKDVPYVLIDADKKLNMSFEKGLKIPLDLVKEVTLKYSKVGIAGGLNPDNVDLVLRYRPYLIDVASGVEVSPGIKSVDLIRKLLIKVRKIEEASY
ncbi:MAG: phosphoribosylanthranilate isomerase [Crenarchaeota archaeon]|nr:phosphoribosylanthranilate isomerase [Thermoproteota archaeon]